MKTITSEHTSITTPWLSRSEAATFLGISEATFNRLNKSLPCPHGGPATCAKFHTQVLTAWFKKLET